MSLTSCEPGLNRRSVALAWLWLGMSFGIAFIEAPTKFRVPSLSYPVALDVGRHVFAASEYAQLLLAALLFISSWRGLVLPARLLLLTALSALLAQRFILYPMLEARALIYLAGATPERGWAHVAYVLVELLKLSAVALFAWSGASDASTEAAPSDGHARTPWSSCRAQCETPPHSVQTS